MPIFREFEFELIRLKIIENRFSFVLLFRQPPTIAHVPPSSTYAPGMNIMGDSQLGKRVPAQGHPLKSFTVPAPPPISAPGTPQAKHIGNIATVSFKATGVVVGN